MKANLEKILKVDVDIEDPEKDISTFKTLTPFEQN